MGINQRLADRDERIAREERYRSTIMICASIIAAVRLSGVRDLASSGHPAIDQEIRSSVVLAKKIMEAVLPRI